MTGLPRVDNKKPTTVCQPWVLVEKSVLTSTSAYGAANYDDDQQSDLPINL